MSKRSSGGRIGSASWANRRKQLGSFLARRLGFESLEDRRLLAVTAPTSVVLQSVPTGQGSVALTSANNSSSSRELTFLVSGVTAGDYVAVYADKSSTPIATSASTVATGATTITVTSNGKDTLSDGTHTFTAKQEDTSQNLLSDPSPASASVQVFSGLSLTQTAVSATAGQAFSYTAQANVPSGDTATITAGTTTLGMTYNSSTHVFSGWTPTAAQAGTTQVFTVDLTDTLGNSSTVSVFVAVAATSGISLISPPTSVAIGSPVLVAFNDANSISGTPTYTVTSSKPGELSATLMPQSNPVLKIVTDRGEMDIQLLSNYTPNTVAHIESLINSNTYATNATFYRIIEDFMIQGGAGGGGSTIPVELSPDLRFTSSGLLAMANNGVDGNSSEFFVTGPNDSGSNTNFSDGFLDFRYTIFGKLVAGDNVRQAIANSQVGLNSSNEKSAPFEVPKILSMSITSKPNTGVLLLKAAPGATGSYTVTISDGSSGSAGTQTLSVTVGGTNPYDPPNSWVKPINGTDTIHVAANTPYTFTPQGVSANNTAVQVNAQLLLPLPAAPGALVDSSYTGTNPVADTTNPNMTLTQNGSSFTVTPTAGYYGVQVLEVTALAPVSGTFKLQVASTTTAAITFDSTNLTATAVNMQAALRTAGFSGATVSVASTSVVPHFRFDVNFATSQAAVSYVATSSALPVTFTNSATASSTSQELTFAATGPSWDSSAGVSPAYRAFVPVYVAPPAPKLASISVGGQTVTGSTFANNASTATKFSFNISGVISEATVSVYVDGVATPIATGTVASGATTITLTTDGTTKLTDGNRQFTVKQTVTTVAQSLYADWTNGNAGAQFQIPQGSVDSAASTATPLTIGLQVLTPPISIAEVGVPYTYVVQTNAPSGDTVTVNHATWTLPPGMQLTSANTFTWTPTSSQTNKSYTFSASVTDSQGRTGSFGPVSILVIVGLPPVQVPLNSSVGGNVTVSFSGSQVQVYDNVAKVLLSNATFKSSDAVTVSLPSGQANSVSVVLPNSTSAAIPKELLVQGISGATNNQVIIVGTGGGNSFTLAGSTITANGLPTIMSTVQKLTLKGGAGNDYYMLNSSALPASIVDPNGYNTLDFGHDTAGVTVNLGLYKGQAQSIAPWNTTLSISGVISKLIGTAYADVLTGGPAATTEIVGGPGNDTLIGGSGDNILLGGGGNDKLVGGPNKNLLIAGSGTCTLYATGQQNMVFGGSTNYDNNDQALINLLNQGPRFMFSYSYRRALAMAARNPSLRASLLTFQDSGAHDTIFGSGINNWLVCGRNGRVAG